MKFLLILMTVFTTGISGSVPDKTLRQVPQHVTVHAVFDYDYLLTLPQGYDDDPTQRWPLLIFLHGIGQRGTDIEQVRKNGLPWYIDQGNSLPFIVIAPQCPHDEWWNLPAIEAFITDMVRNHRVDPERVYLTGLSMGGFGVWALAARHPERYAAVIPISGGGEIKWAHALRDLPIWAFHGAKDKVVPPKQSQAMIDAITGTGGHPKMTIYPHAEHDAWTETYANAEIYTWLLSHRRRQ